MAREAVDRTGEMEVFTAAVAHGSFSGAARALGLTPSAVSRTIGRIEGRLGVRLILRTTRALILTAEGQAYLQGARRVLADLDDVERAIADQGAPRGRVRVSAALSHGRLCVTPAMGEFVARYPHIVVELSLTDTVVDIAAGQADVAIRFGPLADSALMARRLGETGRTIVASPDYLARRGTPARAADLAGHDVIGYDTETPALRAMTAGIPQLSRRGFALRTDSNVAQLAAIRAGYGIGVCQVAIARRDPALVRVLPEIALPLPLWIVMHEDLKSNARFRIVFDALVEGLARLDSAD